MDKVSQLVKFLNHSQNLTPQTIDDFLVRLQLSSDDVAPWKAQEGSVEKSKRNIIHQANNYEISLISWAGSESSSIHMHEKVHWGVIQVFGKAKYAVFKTHDQFLTIKHSTVNNLENGDVIQVRPDTIHQLGSRSPEHFYSLHIYGNDDHCENLTDTAKNFCIQENTLVHIREGEFI